MPSYWLIVERYENWVVDRSENFRRFGLADRRRTLAKRIKPGDLLVVYVTGKSCFSDIRRVLSPTMTPLKLGGPYDAAFSFALVTEPLITLNVQDWLPIKQFSGRLSFGTQSLRSSLRPIPNADGKLIEQAVKRAAMSASSNRIANKNS